MLHTWYNDVEVCMIEDQIGKQSNRSDMISYPELYKQCDIMINGKNTPKNMYDFVKLPSSALARKMRDGCCNDDVPMKNRGFQLVERGFESGNITIVKDFIDLLSLRNQSLVLLGDSMNNQVYNAMIEELKREFVLLNESIGKTINFNAKSEVEWLNNPSAFGVDSSVIQYMGAVASYKGRDGSKIYIYLIDFWYGKRTSAIDKHLMDDVLPLISSQHSPSGIMLLANIGHHLEMEREQFLQKQKHFLVQGIADFVNWLDDMSKLNKRNIVLFRETTPTFFNSPLHDGLYESSKLSGYSKINYMIENDWNDNIYDTGKSEKSLYYCHSLNKTTNTDRPENYYVHKILETWAKYKINSSNAGSYRSKVGVWYIQKHMAPFYKMSYGHCGGYNRIGILDCTHYCLWSPPMWIPLWADLLAIYMRYLKFIDKGSDKNVAEMGGVPVGDYVKDDVKLMKSNVSSDIYAYYHGIRKWAKEIDDFEFEFGVKLDRNAFVEVSGSEMEDIPLGTPVEAKVNLTEKSVIEVFSEYFYYANASRHKIPDWDTFCSLGVNKKNVIHLSFNKMRRIPVGSPLPKHDFPYIC